MLKWYHDPELLVFTIFLSFSTATLIAWKLLHDTKLKMGIRSHHSEEIPDLLVKRLRAYSNLSGNSYHRPISGSYLTIGEHQILLGIIKKVEAKNSVLAAVAALIYAGLISVAKDVLPSISPFSFIIACVGAFLGIYVLAALIDGAGHISNARMQRYFAVKDKGAIIQRKMQSDLAFDLLQKEAKLRFAELSLGTTTVLLLLMLSIEAIWHLL